MSSAINLAGGEPFGLGTFGCFLVLVTTAAASAFTAAVGGDGVVVVWVGVGVVVVVVAALPDGAALGIAAVFPPPPHAARVTQAAAQAIIIRTFSRITARTLARQMTETTQTSRRRPSESRSKEHHVGVGLTFLS